MEKVRRNRTKTTQRITDAFEEVLAERGLQAVGVNRVAERAGVSKVLIYRYFGGMEGLISYYIKMGRLYPNFSDTVLEQLRPSNEEELGRLWHKQLTQLFRQFRNNKASRELLKANTIANDPTADIASQAQDEEITRLVGQFSFVTDVDNEAISAVTIGAMSYLTLLADHNRTMAGIDLRSEEGWKRIEKAIKLIYTSLSKSAVESENTTFIKADTLLDINWRQAVGSSSWQFAVAVGRLHLNKWGQREACLLPTATANCYCLLPLQTATAYCHCKLLLPTATYFTTIVLFSTPIPLMVSDFHFLGSLPFSC